MKPKSCNKVYKYLALGLFIPLNVSKYITNSFLKTTNHGGVREKCIYDFTFSAKATNYFISFYP